LWRGAATTEDGEEYYEYLLVYVDDLMCVSENPLDVIEKLQPVYGYKTKDTGPPKQYLGATITRYHLDGINCWASSAKEYLEKAFLAVEAKYKIIPAQQPLPTSYHPEIDASPPLNNEERLLYGSYVGILQWAVELGRIDVCFATLTMASQLALPRHDHMKKVLQIFGYLKTHLNSRLVYDPNARDWNDVKWISGDWKDYYPEATEQIPSDAPPPRGRKFQTNMFVDADHAANLVNRRSVTGFIIFICGAPIVWYSKRQNTIETSTFGSEFVALKIATERLEALRYKLRMMGIRLDGPTNCFCDSESVVRNVTEPESTLKKKHNSIAYHKVREATAAGILRVAHEPGKQNLSDFLTKSVTVQKMKRDASRVLH